MVVNCIQTSSGAKMYYQNGIRITESQARKLDPNVKCISPGKIAKKTVSRKSTTSRRNTRRRPTDNVDDFELPTPYVPSLYEPDDPIEPPTRKRIIRKTAQRKSTSRKTARRKSTSRKTTQRKSPSREATRRRSTSRKTAQRKSPSRKTARRKSTSRKTAQRKSPSRKATRRRSTSRKTAQRKSPSRKATRRRSPVRRSRKRAGIEDDFELPTSYEPDEDDEPIEPPTKRRVARKVPSRVVRKTVAKRAEQKKPKTGNCIDRSELELRPEQKKVVKYLDTHDSLLVVHGTGLGKTLTAVTASQCYLDKHPERFVVFIGPVSLIDNFKKEIRRYGAGSDMNRYKFFSFDKYYNSYVQGKDDVSLKNKMVIIDEAHNLRNPEGRKSMVLQEAAAEADKKVLLTATPFVNSITDFIPLINILYSGNVVGSYKQWDQGEVSEYIDKRYYDESLETVGHLLRNKVDVMTIKDPQNFPLREDHYIEVPMTKSYYERYRKIASGLDMREQYGILFSEPARFYNGFRRAVNSAGPGYFSSKIEEAIPIILSGKTIIFSNWLEFGIKPVTNALDDNGITYRSFFGDTPTAQRQKIVDEFNDDEFDVLIITRAGGEGLDTKGVRNVIVLDPTWNDAGLEQIIGRAIRYKSHDHLPKKERKVDVYFMILTLPETIPEGETSPESGDVLLYNIIEQKNKFNSAIIEILREVSI